MQPNGMHNGHVQALIATLQGRYPNLLAVSGNPDHGRMWKLMGFELQEAASGERMTRTNRRYRWATAMMSKEHLLAYYTSLLEQEETDAPRDVVNGVLRALERGDTPEAIQGDRDSNRQHMDTEYFQSIRWIWDKAIHVLTAEEG